MTRDERPAACGAAAELRPDCQVIAEAAEAFSSDLIYWWPRQGSHTLNTRSSRSRCRPDGLGTATRPEPCPTVRDAEAVDAPCVSTYDAGRRRPAPPGCSGAPARPGTPEF
jgi:hypothetical protein